jgi:hypothetical protein
MALLRRSQGATEAFGFSLSIKAPTVAMAFHIALMAQAAGQAVPLACLIGGIAATLVARSFVAYNRRLTDAGSVYAFIGSVLGARSSHERLPRSPARLLAGTLIAMFGRLIPAGRLVSY